MKPNTARVLALLRSAGPDGLTPLECLARGGGMRLSGRILELRQDGYAIETHWQTSGDARFARYVLTETGQRTLGLVG